MQESQIILKIYSINSQIATLDAKPGAANLVRVQPRSNIEIVNMATGKAPPKVKVTRSGNDLVIQTAQEDGQLVDIVLEDYYGNEAGLIGLNEAGSYAPYVAAGPDQVAIKHLGDGAISSFQSLATDRLVSPFWTATSLQPSLPVVGLATVATAAVLAQQDNAAQEPAVPPVPEAPAVAVPEATGGISAAEAANGVVVVVSLPTGAAAGDVITVSIDGGTPVRYTVTATDASATLNPGRTVDITLPGAAITAAGEGPAVITTIYANAQGAAAAPVLTSVIIDTQEPSNITALAITAIGDDTGTVGDWTTRDTTLTVSGTYSGTLDTGDQIQVSSDGGITWANATSQGAGVWNFIDPVTRTASFTYQVRVVDAALNPGSASASQAITLLKALGFVINGESSGDESGYSVSGAGDVNGDGLADVIVGAHRYDAPGQSNAGRSYVVFGTATAQTIDLSTIASNSTAGFVITGEMGQDLSGSSVSAAGDVNGDGRDDLIVGASFNDTSGDNAGRTYVIFGKSDGSAINLSAFVAGTDGFVINGEQAFDLSGFSVSAAGDVNGDGLSDLIVGAYLSDPNGLTNAGRSYVVFGKSDGIAVNLSDVFSGTGGFAINGQISNDRSGYSVSGAGDVNGDGLADLVVGAPNAVPSAGADAGRSYVVFGKSDTSAVDLSAITSGAGGFVINGERSGDESGYSVSGAGDVNGDGFADLIVGAYLSDPNGLTNAGRSYVVFGKAPGAEVNLSDVASGNGGFIINGEARLDGAIGVLVSAAGDVNGDGLADLIVGAPANDPNGVAGAGRSYVVFGKTNTSAVDLRDVASGTGGFAISGQSVNDASGYSVSAAGDIDGDGLDDLLIGVYQADVGANSDVGRSYVVFGKANTGHINLSDVAGGGVPNAITFTGTASAETWTGSAAAEVALGGEGNDTLIGGGGADVLYGGAGNDVLVINASNATALIASYGSGGNTALLSRINGGGGIDTLRLSDGANLDFTAVANTAAGNPKTSSRIASIERIDLASDAAGNEIKLSVNDVVDMAGMNNFNNATGWTDGSYDLGATLEARHQVVVSGSALDRIDIDLAAWSNVGTVTQSGTVYEVYNATSSAAQLLVQQNVVVI